MMAAGAREHQRCRRKHHIFDGRASSVFMLTARARALSNPPLDDNDFRQCQ